MIFVLEDILIPGTEPRESLLLKVRVKDNVPLRNTSMTGHNPEKSCVAVR